MPTRAPKACVHNGCADLVYDGGSRCTAHRRSNETPRPSAAARGYDAYWRKVRDRYLSTHPYCADPYQVHGSAPVFASEVDHIIALRRGGTHDESNLRGLCGLCHRRKTAKEDGGGFYSGGRGV